MKTYQYEKNGKINHVTASSRAAAAKKAMVKSESLKLLVSDAIARKQLAN